MVERGRDTQLPSDGAEVLTQLPAVQPGGGASAAPCLAPTDAAAGELGEQAVARALPLPAC